MGTKVKELSKIMDIRGDTHECAVCKPAPKKVYHDKVWAWSLANPGINPFKEDNVVDKNHGV